MSYNSVTTAAGTIHLKFDGSIADANGVATPSLVGGVAAYVAGQFGSALTCDPSGAAGAQGVLIPAAAISLSGDWSAACWTQHTAWSGAPIDATNCGVFGPANGTAARVAYQYQSAAECRFRAIQNGFTLLNNSANVAPGSRHHVAVTYDRTNELLRLYLNGALVAGPTAAIATYWGVDAGFWFGRMSEPNRVLPGNIDDAVLAPTLWSDADIAALYAGPAPISTVAPTLASNGDWTGGSWDSQGNGTITYTHELRKNGVTVATLSGASGNALSLFQTYGFGSYTMYVRASNNGGYDVTQDKTTAAVLYTQNTLLYRSPLLRPLLQPLKAPLLQ